MAKLTEEELRKIIQEELENIEEGPLDRFLARARGSLEKGKAGVSNIGKGISQTFKGEKPSGRVNVEKVKKYSTALSIVNSAAKKVLPTLDQMKEDIEKMIEGDESLGSIKAFQELMTVSDSVNTIMKSIQNEMTRDLQNIKKKG